MKVGDAMHALDQMREIEIAVKKIGAYISMYGEKGEVNPININVAMEVVRRAVLQASMNGVNPESEEGKAGIAQVAELADLFLDMAHSNVKMRSKDHSNLPDILAEEMDIGDN